MPHFHFHLRRGREVEHDELGVAFADVDSAYLDAYRAVQDMWFDLVREQCDPMQCSFEIADEDGRLVLELPFAEVMDPGRPGGRVRGVASVGTRIGRARHLAGEIAVEIDKARETLSLSRALLSRARGEQAA